MTEEKKGILSSSTTLKPATPPATPATEPAEPVTTESNTAGTGEVENEELDDETRALVDSMFSTPMPTNPKAVDFGAKTVNVGGRELKMPSTVVNDSDFGTYTDEGFQEPIAAFKHHNVKRFNVGKHTFQNHILQIFTESDLVDFLTCWEGLQGPDKVNITQYDWQAAARVNTPVSDLISRGSMATKNIKDPKQVG